MATDRTRRRSLTLGVLVSVLIVVLYATGGVVSGLRHIANVVVTPFSWSVNEVSRPVGHFLAGAIDYSDVVAQNKRLRYELGVAQTRLNETSGLERQMAQMRAVTHVPFLDGIPTLLAQVSSVSPTNFAATIDIGVGRDEGVMAGMPVVANGGLVGIVTSSSSSGATVRLITDAGSLVATTFGNGTANVLVGGRGVNNGLGASSVDQSAGLNVGAVLSTNGLSGNVYPPGIPVATITKLTQTPGSSTYSVILQPTADLSNLHYVDVVLWEPST